MKPDPRRWWSAEYSQRRAVGRQAQYAVVALADECVAAWDEFLAAKGLP
jgi:hypothetical protein